MADVGLTVQIQTQELIGPAQGIVGVPGPTGNYIAAFSSGIEDNVGSSVSFIPPFGLPPWVPVTNPLTLTGGIMTAVPSTSHPLVLVGGSGIIKRI